jgi:hypothetical protein
MSELVVALALAAALGAKPVPAHADPQQQARSRPPAAATKARVAQTQPGKPKEMQRRAPPHAL